ncbi:MAG TPA: glycosyltransferase 61 family protein [Noviherbaspirillum sp.]|nr:glycosyltransferase 61 family protein [Noviherbaspirillum sp.]
MTVSPEFPASTEPAVAELLAHAVSDALRQALQHHQAGQLQAAEELYLGILEIQPAHPEANNNLGLLAVQMRQPDSALRYFEAAVLARPGNGQYWLDYIDALLQTGHVDGASQVLKIGRRNGLKEEVVKAAETLIGLMPDEPSPEQFDEFAGLYESKQFVEADAAARALTRRYPRSGACWKMLAASLSAQRLAGATKLAELMKALQKAAELLPDDFEVPLLLAQILRDQRQFADAEAACRRAIATKPYYAPSHNLLGVIFGDQGRHSDAEACFRTALGITPDYTDGHRWFGKLLFEMQQFEKAMEHYRVAFPTSRHESIVVGTVLDVKSWCKLSGAPYHLVGAVHDIVVPDPQFIGEKFDAEGGVASTNELYVAELSEARIFGKSNAIIVGQGAVLYDLLTGPYGDTVNLIFEDVIKYHHQRKLLIDFSSHKQLRHQRGILLSGPSSKVYGHWFAEFLPKIKLVDSIPAYRDYPIYVDDDMPASHYQALELLTGGKRELIRIGADTSIVFDKLIVAPLFTFFPFACKPDTPTSVHIGTTSPEACLYLRERFLESVGLDSKPLPRCRRGRRIYLGRRSEGRKLRNESEVQNFLAKFGFEIVYPEDFTFKEQIKLFNEAECIIGPHGSAFVNAIFCKQGAKVASLVHSYGANFAAWANAVEELGCQHLYVAGQAVGESWNDHHLDYVVPIELVAQLIEHFEIGA